MNVGESVTFAYTGDIQSYTVDASGYYKLECWGGSGGTGAWYFTRVQTSGGRGGYACGYKKLKKGTTIYIVVGGAGTFMSSGYGSGDSFSSTGGGYNGGGNGYAVDTGSYDSETQEHTYKGVSSGGGSGGGATHIALNEGALLKNTTAANVLIVAGGGGGGNGGSAGWSDDGYSSPGGAGGNAATGEYGQGASLGRASGHYENTRAGIHIGGGGGGGYAGGTTAERTGGGGGSSYTDGTTSVTIKGVTYEPTTTAGQWSGNGQAIVTLVKKVSVYLGDMDADLYIGDNAADDLYVGDNPV